MAPRPPQSREEVVKELREQAGWLERTPYCFGAPEWAYAVVAQDGVFRVRRLELDQARAMAYAMEAREKGRSFQPEDAESFKRPTGEVLLEAPTLEGLLARLEAGPWPLE